MLDELQITCGLRYLRDEIAAGRCVILDKPVFMEILRELKYVVKEIEALLEDH